MNKGVTVALATISSALAIGTFVLGGFTLGTTHSVNPLNMKVYLDFKNWKVDSDRLCTKNFKNVQNFVKANGKGTLIAKNIGGVREYEFKYYEASEAVDITETHVAFRDWQAVREYMNWLEWKECEKEYETAPKASESDSANMVASEIGGGQEGNNSCGSIIVHKSETPPQAANNGAQIPEETIDGVSKISDEVENALKELNFAKDYLDKMLGVFWKAKCAYMRTQLYAMGKTKFTTFRPKRRVTTFLQASSEKNMKIQFYSENKWSDWKPLIEPTIGKEKLPNPVSACCAYGSCTGYAKLSYDTQLSQDETKKCLTDFIKLFYRLAGISFDNKHHKISPSQGF